MMLSNLTWSGWIVFALAAYFDVKFLAECVMAAAALRSERKLDKAPEVGLLGAVVFTVWLVWLVTP